MNLKKYVENFILVSLLLLVLVLAGCSSQEDKADVTQSTATKVKVGLMVPLSGDVAPYGESVKKAAELAVKDLGLEDKMELVIEDSKCEGKEAVTVINKLVGVDKVQAVIGELCSGASIPASAVANQYKVPMISPASTSPELTVNGGEYFFRVIPSDALQGAFGAKLVYDKGVRKLAVLYGNEDYGVGFNKVLREEFPKLGGEVVASEAFERKSTDLRAQLTKIKSANPDAIYIIANSLDSGVAALKQIKELGLEVMVVVSEGLKADDVLKNAGNAAEGILVTSVSTGTVDFVSHHKEVYNTEPGPFAAQAYDAVKALSMALATGADTSEEIKEALKSVTFSGVSGNIAFDSNGDVGGNYEVYVVKDGKFAAEE